MRRSSRASARVSDLVAAAEAEATRDVLAEAGFDYDAEVDLSEAVRDVVASHDALLEARRELTDVEHRYVAMGERYYRERQWRVNVAAVARRVLARTHSESHAGSVEMCPTCGSDWALANEASGVTAPAS
jgi:hypothetical protein